MDRKASEFISKQLGEEVLEYRKCKRCGEEFPIFSGDKLLMDKISPKVGNQTFELPLPTLCPSCRRHRRFMFRNERHLYHNKCEITGKKIITIYAPNSGYKVYDKDLWESDKWEGKDYAMDYNLDKTFSEQFALLNKQVPRSSLLIARVENADYANYCSFLKNCYLLYDCSHSEDCCYSYDLGKSKDTLDCNDGLELQNCYEIVNTIFSYNCFFCYNVVNSSDIYFSVNLEGCKNCIFCSSLVNKEYCIENKQYTKEEYKQKLSELKDKMKSYRGLKELLSKYRETKKNAIYKNLQLVNTENVFGNFVNNSKNSLYSYDSAYIEDNRYVANTNGTMDCMDFESCSQPCTKCYQVNGTMLCHNVSFGIITWCDDSCYVDHCFWSKNIFGSVGIKNAEYVILNKQYTKEEYEKLVPQIIDNMKKTGERGEFFDPSVINIFPYNDTIAYDFFPIHKVISSDGKEKIINEKGKGIVYIKDDNVEISDAILDLGGEVKIAIKRRTQEKEINVPASIELVKTQDLSDSIDDVNDEILKKAIICEVSGRPFRIVKMELDFYRKHGLPLPRKHPDVRHADRIAQRPVRELYLRKCDNCDIDMISVYPQDTEFKVYCNECYTKEIY